MSRASIKAGGVSGAPSGVSIVFVVILCMLVIAIAFVVIILPKCKPKVTEGFTTNRDSTIPAAKYVLDDPGALHACIAAANVCGTRDGYFPGSISTIADLVVKGEFDVGDKSTLQNDLNVLRSLTVNGMATMGGKMQFGDSLRVGRDASSQNANVENGLDVKGSSTFRQNLDVNNSMGIAGNATLDGNMSVGSSTTVSREMQIAQALNINGAATFGQAVNAGNTRVERTLSVSNPLTVTGQAIINGITDVGGKLYVKGSLATGVGDVTVTGDSVMDDSMFVSNVLHVGEIGRFDGGLQVQSRNGGWTTIGAQNGGYNSISGPTTINNGDFCINKECVDIDKLSKIRYTEENLTQRLEEWDTVTKVELDNINKIVFDHDGLLKTHDTEEIAKYQHMINALTHQQTRLNDLSMELKSIKKEIAKTKRYELEQDKILSRLEGMMKKTNDTYFESMKKIVDTGKCVVGGGDATPSSETVGSTSSLNATPALGQSGSTGPSGSSDSSGSSGSSGSTSVNQEVHHSESSYTVL